MDIGYGEGFVWYSDNIPSEIVKIRTENNIIVSYTAKNTNTGFMINYLLGKDTFYNTYSKVNTGVKDKGSVKYLETAKSKSGVNVSLGDLWVTKDDNAMLCEVVSIIKEDGTTWVDSYSEEDGQVDGDTIDGFVNSYELVESCGDVCDNLSSYDNGFEDGFSKGKDHNKDEQNLNYRLGLSTGKDIGWAECENKLHSEMSERDLELKQQGFKDGYNQAVMEMGEQGEDFWDEECQEAEQKPKRKHSHYFKDVRHLDYIDVYLINKLFPVDDDSDCILHARKKLLVCGGRGGGKSMIKDVTEARDTLNRYLQIEGVENEDS